MRVPLSGSVRVQGAEIGELIETYGHQKYPVDGVASGLAKVSGTLADPKADLQAIVEKVTLYGEQFDHFRGEILYQQTGVEVLHGELDHGNSTVLFSGAYRHDKDDWKSGNIRFDLTTARFTLQQLKNVQDLQQSVEGAFDLKATGTATIRNAEPVLNTLDGRLSLQNSLSTAGLSVMFPSKQKTTGPELRLSLAGDVAGAKLTGIGNFQMSGDDPGTGHVEISPVRLSALQDLLQPAGKQKMPFDGEVVASATFSGPLLKPGLMKGSVEIPRLEVIPTRMPDISGKQAKDLTVRNSKPIVFDVDPAGIHIRSAQIVGLDTNLRSFRGLQLPRPQAPLGPACRRQCQFRDSSGFPARPDIRRTYRRRCHRKRHARPSQLNGRLEFKNASFYMADLPNGIDQATGAVIFDQNRATIVNRLTAQTGGGEIALTGFVGYGAGEVVYRLQAAAKAVRVRMEGVSLTFNACAQPHRNLCTQPPLRVDYRVASRLHAEDRHRQPVVGLSRPCRRARCSQRISPRDAAGYSYR